MTIECPMLYKITCPFFKRKCLSVANIGSLKLSRKTIPDTDRGVATISWRGFQIGSNENGWSKILTLHVYMTLAFTVRKQNMLWLPLSERVHHFLNIYVFGGGNWCSSTLAKTWSTSGMFLTFLVSWMSAQIQLTLTLSATCTKCGSRCGC